ncbi:MAG TPA: ABC transporter permease subunit [Bryobacteraceae bacterium]|jgi:ABC-type transport system involved in multi-copper enzyme maturation permease subunit
MNTSTWTQLSAVMRLELRKTFFTRRGWWIYILAFAPALLYLIHSIDSVRNHEQRQALAAANPVALYAIKQIQVGDTIEDVEKQLGPPYFHLTFKRREFEVRVYRYTNGDSDFAFNFFNGKVTRIDEEDRCNLQKDSAIFATTFQFFYLRLAVFFGCVGIFTNLFRGEMLDKSLHFYLLAPMRREVLLAGKYLAGLAAAVVIFTFGTALQIAALSWHFDKGVVPAYMHGTGWTDIASYLGITALACVGYGGIFLAAGLLFKNPIVPAAVVLLWEAANIFLPAALKKISVIFYLQSLCPLVASPDKDMSPFLRLLLSSAEPAAPWVAIGGLLAVTALVLTIAGLRSRKLEINYGTE